MDRETQTTPSYKQDSHPDISQSESQRRSTVIRSIADYLAETEDTLIKTETPAVPLDTVGVDGHQPEASEEVIVACEGVEGSRSGLFLELMELYHKKLRKKTTKKPYNEEIKKFAITMFSYSPKAYRYYFIVSHGWYNNT